MKELKERAQVDFSLSGLESHEWPAFWKGYMMALKRFGGRK